METMKMPKEKANQKSTTKSYYQNSTRLETIKVKTYLKANLTIMTKMTEDKLNRSKLMS